jgi:hypothetical protein
MDRGAFRSAILPGMDPYAPINGISLERYAELSADCSETQDPNAQAEIVAKKGVPRADWEAAKAGWTARMADMSLMGQVATRFMPLYNAELAKKSGGAPTVSFEDSAARPSSPSGQRPCRSRATNWPRETAIACRRARLAASPSRRIRRR